MSGLRNCFHDNYQGAPNDGSAWTTGCDSDYRVIRGGSWHQNAQFLRAADRIAREAYDRRGQFYFFHGSNDFALGFRLAHDK